MSLEYAKMQQHPIKFSVLLPSLTHFPTATAVSDRQYPKGGTLGAGEPFDPSSPTTDVRPPRWCRPKLAPHPAPLPATLAFVPFICQAAASRLQGGPPRILGPPFVNTLFARLFRCRPSTAPFHSALQRHSLMAPLNGILLWRHVSSTLLDGTSLAVCFDGTL